MISHSLIASTPDSIFIQSWLLPPYTWFYFFLNSLICDWQYKYVSILFATFIVKSQACLLLFAPPFIKNNTNSLAENRWELSGNRYRNFYLLKFQDIVWQILEVLTISKLQNNFCIHICEFYMPFIYMRPKCLATKFVQQKPCRYHQILLQLKRSLFGKWN